jgi:hypothetical protein
MMSPDPVMIDTEPVSLWFFLPATDPLGREEVHGKLRFLPEHVELHWRLKGNVFRNGAEEGMTRIDLPYGEIEHVDLVKRFWKLRRIILRIGDPSLVAAIPGVTMGKMELHIDDRSRQEAAKLSSFIDFRRSIFLLDEQTKRLTAKSNAG